MTEINSKTFIIGVANDLRIAVDDLTEILISVHADVEKLKVKTSKPDIRIL